MICLVMGGIASASSAQRSNDPLACTYGQIYIGGNPITTSLRWSTPGEFPQPATLNVLSGSWELKCPTFTAQADGSTLLIKSTTDRPEDALSFFQRDFSLITDGYYKYPALQMDWQQFRLSLVWDGGDLVEAKGTVLPDVIIGYREDDGPLRQLAYEGRVSSEKLSASAGFEIFLKRTVNIQPLNWAYVKFDPKNKTVTLKRSHPFPDS